MNLTGSDIKLMKQHNFNAVRTGNIIQITHVGMSSAKWVGCIVVDERHIEPMHVSMGRLAFRSHNGQAHFCLSALYTKWLADKTMHQLYLSLGNECGYGPNMNPCMGGQKSLSTLTGLFNTRRSRKQLQLIFALCIIRWYDIATSC